MPIQTNHQYIVRRSLDSEPYIDGTKITVTFVVNELGRETNFNGELENLVRAYPNGYLSKEKVISALAYYQDHKEEIEIYIAENKRDAGKIFKTR